MGNDIPILEYSDTPEKDPLWTSFMGHLLHPDYSHPVFLRHNYSNVNLFNIFNNETVFLLGRGPSLGKFLENSKIKKMLLNPFVTTFGMNTVPELLDFNLNLWSCVDRMTKFPRQIAKNPNIMKFIPMNRLMTYDFDCRTRDNKKTLAYSDDHTYQFTATCPNTFGVQTFLLSKNSQREVTFGNAFLNCPAVLYGLHQGHKCILLFALKICLLLGFKKIVLIGIDFKMDNQEPYYKNTADDYNQFHVQHNNRMYNALTPLIKEVVTLLHKKKSQYRCKICTANKIKDLPFIPEIDLGKELKQIITQKTK